MFDIVLKNLLQVHKNLKICLFRKYNSSCYDSLLSFLISSDMLTQNIYFNYIGKDIKKYLSAYKRKDVQNLMTREIDN